MRRGKIWLINLDPTVGAEIRRTRPAVVVNDDAVGILPLRVIVPVTEWKDCSHRAFPPSEELFRHTSEGGRKC